MFTARGIKHRRSCQQAASIINKLLLLHLVGWLVVYIIVSVMHGHTNYFRDHTRCYCCLILTKMRYFVKFRGGGGDPQQITTKSIQRFTKCQMQSDRHSNCHRHIFVTFRYDSARTNHQLKFRGSALFEFNS